MGRDMVPREKYYYEKQLNFEGKSMKLHRIDSITYMGKTTKIDHTLEDKLDKQYPWLSFLYDDLCKIYKLLDKHPKYRARVLRDIERHLTKLLDVQDLYDTDDVIWNWYNGKLDSSFYYRDENDRLFGKYIVNEVKKLCNKR